jgi:hypothetical protein
LQESQVNAEAYEAAGNGWNDPWDIPVLARPPEEELIN